MSFRWLSSTVGVRFRPGIRRKMAPLAQHDLSAEIDADALTVRRVWLRDLPRDGDGEPRPTVIARVDPGARSEIVAWLEADLYVDGQPAVRTDWLFFPAAPEAVLIGIVEGVVAEDQPLRFNLRLAADRWRRQLKGLARTGQLGLTLQPLALGEAGELLTPCRYVPIQTEPLRAFLRELPPVPVV